MTKEKTCAVCNKDLDFSYYKCNDNFLQAKYFEEPDESDNVFCSIKCITAAFSIEEEYVEEDYEYDMG